MHPRILCAMLLPALALGLPAGPAAAQQPPGGPPSGVTVLTATPETYTVTARLPGRVRASTIAEVRPQVSGIIRERLFEEGARVEVGQPLYKIEDETYAAALEAAAAAVTEAQANYDLAVLEADRQAELYERRTVSEASRDQTAAARAAAAAALQVAQARLTSARIDLDRTTIRAPVAGIIGLSETTTGALVAAQQSLALATIRTLDPIFVDVTQSANDLLNWNTPASVAERARNSTTTLTLPTGQEYIHKGALKAAEPRVEPTTGMVTLRVTFPNPEYRLLPGLYVEVDVPRSNEDGVFRIPGNAILRNPQGGVQAWVVEDGKIAARDVTLLAMSGSTAIVSSGLKDGDRVVTSGFQKAGPGAPVQIVEPTGASVAAAAPGGAAPAREGN